MQQHTLSDDLMALLPSHLAERTRPLGQRARPVHGEFVLYWMHHAVRGHENPALDVALSLANHSSLPVLVYQGLGGSHRYNNDRHYAFILQGARDVQRELQARGIRYLFHLDPDNRGPSPLHTLARRAAALVVEDYPAVPFPAWSQGLARRSPAPTVAVDCSCIVPMCLQTGRYDRAYAFRRANQAEYARRLTLEWRDTAPDCPPFAGDPGCEGLDLDQADIGALCAACAIDHSVPPVAHTVGGSRAGYVRWEAFRASGLGRYARDRNDAALDWPRGVSRLSPYLHHGHVSPFRIAREAAHQGGDGADKFLDELLIWRELAHNLCFTVTDPETLDCLPVWARETLAAHASDRRPLLLDDDALARSASGDALWDLAQASLRIHGELHNNLRMTWAKAVLHWRPDPAAALRTLIDLNHRYALDGSDPNSYGGLLWALGLYDRPFSSTPVLGQVRARSTRSHAKRLDVERYRARIMRPSSGRSLRVAVIGAGVAGLSAARTLHDQGHRVSVFEKSRGLGGRAATRRRDGIGLDHGAQYFTADDPRFRRVVDAWCESGRVAPWSARIGKVTGDGIVASPDDRERFVALPGMSALGRVLGEDLEVQRELRVAPPRYSNGCWTLSDDQGGQLGRYDALIVAAPAPQAAELLRACAPDLAEHAARVHYAPTWAVMLSLRKQDNLPFDGLFFATDELSWAARNSSKPGRDGNTWVLHASAAWTSARLTLDREAAASELVAAFCRRTGIDPADIELLDSHRWLYSLAEQPLEVGALWEAGRRLAVCGDWCQGSRIQGAYLSGQAAAGYVLRDLSLDGPAQPHRADHADALADRQHAAGHVNMQG